MDAARRFRPAFAIAALALIGAAPAPAFNPPPFAHWIDGTTASEPQTQVQAIDADTFVIRQSVKTNFEAPFLYLLFGHKGALLIDTGAGGLAVRPTVEKVIAQWRQAHGGRPLHLTVAHSHSHGDHHAGDSEFAGRPDTTVVGLAPTDVASAFHVADWPNGIGTLDLGRRVLRAIPTPGHQSAHVMIYDPRTRLLFSGDMLYPGRLYVPENHFAEFRASAHRLATFAQTHPIRALLGAHIEMTTTPGLDYPNEAPTHPAEHGLALSPAAIAELVKVVDGMGDTPVKVVQADFIVFPVEPRPN
ncbi:glyoxylase-like metal-dependent hydrolase (beta-lactamase superfamily II) [Novosphingobium sp. SG919]|nr:MULTISPECIES: MBL fold metallo-hydrolase [unclassified Novosphingobium]NMN03335.1 glyoxylase-like metal-dependent hydrolase (beta-lactamase superfamily II) [Novosphingobium sp. SG919]